MLVVQKFGGSSLSSPERIRAAARICRERLRLGDAAAVVVSAMGDSTELMLRDAARISTSPPPRETDALLCTGEQQSAALMAMMLQRLGVPAESYTGFQAGVLTDSVHGAANITKIEPARLREALNRGVTPVVCGFQGIDGEGDLTTLGRGGSDTTAVAMSAALGADRCEIYTDVKYIYTADPRIVSGARAYEEMDYKDMLRLARCGAQVLRDTSVELAMANGVEIVLLSSFEPEGGTVVRALADDLRPDIAGVTADRERCTVSAVGKAVDGHTALVMKRALYASGLVPGEELVTEGTASVSVPDECLNEAIRAVHRALIE